ncbi:DeoR/GlpR family DNA-binding transcription regulator [Clostridium paraputrificum]|uniref:DeoR/GlpR family DNA-binding transcription regulator n=1 Tax=Clostridium paraputrificum TaxID=29363 RepID=UPI00325AB6CB
MGLYMDQKKSKILNIIFSETRISTKELSKRLNLSMETVRRYLDALEKESKIKRVHGGAERLDSYTSEENISVRITQREREKRKIAKLAAQSILDGDKIIIDEGSTTLQLVNFLEGKKELLIITSSFPVAIAIMNLLNQNKITGELIFLGGIVQSDNKRTVGDSCIEVVDRYFVDKAFISCEGITLKDGITAFNDLKARVTRKFIAQAKEIIILADYSKIGIRNHYKIDELINVNRIITNKDAPPEWKEKLEFWNIKWDKAK